MKNIKKLIILILILVPAIGFSTEVDFPEYALEGIKTELKFSGLQNDTNQVQINGEVVQLISSNGSAVYELTINEKQNISIVVDGETFEKEINPIALWLSVMPPLIAILLALVFKEVVTSLVFGIFVGAFIIQYHQEGFLLGLVGAFQAVISEYIVDSVNDSGHISVILFSTIIGGMVAVISKNGGMQGVVNRISKFASNAKNGQLATWFLGVAIFFDDYANTLVVGNTMRPVTDKLKISREKLAYLVDSTAAPVAAIAFVTTWIGAELGYIGDGVASIDGLNEGSYSIFINSLAYSFYPILTLAFMLMLILMNKDYGPMHKAETNARLSDSSQEVSHLADDEMKEFEAIEGVKPKAFNAIIPVLVVIVGTICGLLYTGIQAAGEIDESLSFARKLSLIIGSSDSYLALLWSSLAGLAVAVLLTISQRIMSLGKTIESSIKGFKSMLTAIIILVLAWSLALITEHLHTADFITLILSDNISPILVPALTFVLAAIVAFSTGSSWGTMAILYPLMLPAAWKISQDTGYNMDETMNIFYNVVSCVLAGSVLGDHCSPISDTTILSSLATSCDHIQHVNTQLPYALTVGIVAIVMGTIPAAFGISSFILFPVALLILFLIVKFVGKKVIVT